MNATETITAEEFKDAWWLVFNRDKTLGSIYHDAGSCWRLIDAFREIVSQQEMELKKLKEVR